MHRIRPDASKKMPIGKILLVPHDNVRQNDSLWVTSTLGIQPQIKMIVDVIVSSTLS